MPTTVELDESQQMIVDRYNPVAGEIPTIKSCWERELEKDTYTDDMKQRMQEKMVNYCNFINPENIKYIDEILGGQPTGWSVADYQAKLGDYSCQLQNDKCVPQPYKPPEECPECQEQNNESTGAPWGLVIVLVIILAMILFFFILRNSPSSSISF